MGEGMMEFDRTYLKPFFVFEYSYKKQQEVDEIDEKFIRKKKETEDRIKLLIADKFRR